MCRNINYWLCIVLLTMTTGCTKDVNLELGGKTPLYVIEGRISNLEGPYFVRITKSTNQVGRTGAGGIDDAEAVQGALVILSDDTGMKDTLVPLGQSTADRFYYSYREGRMDSAKAAFISIDYTAERGYYQTTHIKGQVGHTYHLQVLVDGKEFQATAYMPSAPSIDSAAIKPTPVMPNGMEGLLPFIYFKEPAGEKNYYLLQYNQIKHYPYDISGASYSSYEFPYYVVDDNILPAYVNGLAIRVINSGHNPYGSNYNSVYRYDPLQVRLSSLTKEAYEYYRVLISQFEDDGNVYKPVPTSAAGNISGGAVGLFYATHVSYKLILP